MPYTIVQNICSLDMYAKLYNFIKSSRPLVTQIRVDGLDNEFKDWSSMSSLALNLKDL